MVRLVLSQIFTALDRCSQEKTTSNMRIDVQLGYMRRRAVCVACDRAPRRTKKKRFSAQQLTGSVSCVHGAHC